jgi:hypothetical protein
VKAADETFEAELSIVIRGNQVPELKIPATAQIDWSDSPFVKRIFIERLEVGHSVTRALYPSAERSTDVKSVTFSGNGSDKLKAEFVAFEGNGASVKFSLNEDYNTSRLIEGVLTVRMTQDSFEYQIPVRALCVGSR